MALSIVGLLRQHYFQSEMARWHLVAMSSPDNGNTDGKTPGRFKSEPDPDMPIEGDDESSELMINIKEEPMDEDYYQNYSNTNGDTCPSDSAESAELDDDVESNNFDNIRETNEDVRQQTVVTKIAIAPVTTVPNGGGLRSNIKTTKILPKPMKFAGMTTKQVVASTRLLPVGLKTSCPIPIALTVNTPEVDPKAKAALTTSQTSAHHLMTLATEADKILKRQKKTSEKGSNSDHTDDDKLSYSDEEDGMCTSDSSNGLDPFANCSDQTLTLIQRRAAEASLSASKSKKTKRKRNQLPDDLKDQTYWERRRKNNEAAKRSRDARRAKEDQIAIRAALLEQENMRLKIEVAALKEETIKLRGMLYDKR
ncbi:uncharacterized protein [Asterias amurensis]|uniref:uncharacterized protein n=1 Tax=Asterias amurensis TaxID=7602 RepID=UPI003AB8773B